MDSLDIKILREFLQGDPSLSMWPQRTSVRPSVTRLSRKLGLAESTVRDRSRKLSGFVPRWTLMVNPSLMDARWGAIWLEVPPQVSKREALERLALVDDVTVTVNYSGRWLAVAFLYDDGTTLQRKVGLINRLLGSRKSISTDIPIPPCDVELSRTDVKIILSRQADMAKSNRMVADELRLSTRTVRRRLTRLVQARAAWPLALLNASALERCIFANLLVLCRDPRERPSTEAQIMTMLDDYVFFNATFVDLALFNLILPSIPAGEAILDRVTRMEGVRLARIEYVADWSESHRGVERRLKGMVARRAAR